MCGALLLNYYYKLVECESRGLKALIMECLVVRCVGCTCTGDACSG